MSIADLTDHFGRTITGVDNGDGSATYSTSGGPSITVSIDEPADSVIASFNGMSPSIATLSIEKQRKLLQFNAAVMEYVSVRYDRDTQFRFLTLYTLAVLGGQSNRASYVLQLLTWVQSVLTYSAIFSASVMAQSDATAVAGMQWDFSNITADPGVTILGAMAISN